MPVTPEQLVAKLIAIGARYGMPHMDDAAWEVLLAPYAEALSDVPPECLDDALADYGGVFYPRPEDLRKLAVPCMDRLRTLAARERAAAENAPRPRPTAEQRAEGVKELRELAASLGAGKPMNGPQEDPRAAPEPVQPVVATELEDEPEEVL